MFEEIRLILLFEKKKWLYGRLIWIYLSWPWGLIRFIMLYLYLPSFMINLCSTFHSWAYMMPSPLVNSNHNHKNCEMGYAVSHRTKVASRFAWLGELDPGSPSSLTFWLLHKYWLYGSFNAKHQHAFLIQFMSLIQQLVQEKSEKMQNFKVMSSLLDPCLGYYGLFQPRNNSTWSLRLPEQVTKTSTSWHMHHDFISQLM